jgi:hypothetical protein
MFIITLGLLTHTPVPAPKCTVNLDDPPESRWIGCIDQQIATHGWNNTYAPVFRFIDEVVPKSMWFQHDELLTNVALPIVGEEMAAEVRGVFKHIQSIQGKNATTLSELLFLQIFYEILMQCVRQPRSLDRLVPASAQPCLVLAPACALTQASMHGSVGCTGARAYSRTQRAAAVSCTVATWT